MEHEKLTIAWYKQHNMCPCLRSRFLRGFQTFGVLVQETSTNSKGKPRQAVSNCERVVDVWCFVEIFIGCKRSFVFGKKVCDLSLCSVKWLIALDCWSV